MTAELCEACGERPASIQYIEVVGGEKRARSVCDACVAKEPLIDPGVIQQAASHLFEQVLHSADIVQAAGFTKPSEPAHAPGYEPCPGCGLTWADFKEHSRLGCPACYRHFGDEVERVVERLHGSTRHQGRAPQAAVERAERVAKRIQIRSELDAAVEEEDYEKAARLRDALRLLGPEETGSGTV